MEKADRWAGVKFYFAVRVDPGNAPRGRPAHRPDAAAAGKEDRRRARSAAGLRAWTISPTISRCIRCSFRSSSRRRAIFPAPRAAAARAWWILFLNCAPPRSSPSAWRSSIPTASRPLSLKEATTAQTYQLTRAGFYQLRLANGRQDLIGVNPDRRESDLDVIPDDVLALVARQRATQQPQQAAAGARSSRNRRPSPTACGGTSCCCCWSRRLRNLWFRVNI